MKLRIRLRRLYYRARDAMLDDAWERDVALANRWARWYIVPPILIVAALLWWLFELDTQWAIEEAFRDWEWPY